MSRQKEDDLSKFSRQRACDIVKNGLTYRKLCYWLRTGLIRGPANKITFTWEDLIELKMICALIQAGVSVQAIRKGLRYNHILTKNVGQTTLVTDGKTLFKFEDDTGAIIDLLHAGQMVMGIFLPKIIEQLCSQAQLYQINVPQHISKKIENVGIYSA